MIENYIIIDSNFLFLPYQFKIDYLSEITMNLGNKSNLIIFRQVLDELKSKQKREPNARKFEMNLQAAIFYLEKNRDRYNIQFIEKKKEFNETTDEFLINGCLHYKAENRKVFLATNDSKLRKKAAQLGIGRIYLKQKQFLAFEGI
jgi:rRNA-processing protein FCF1